MKQLLTAIALASASASASATIISGESPYCIAHCINGLCEPIMFNLGQKNATIGLPLGVPFTTQTGSRIAPATSYAWGYFGGPHGTPSNLTGMSSDLGNTFTIGKITMNDSGLYSETGHAPPQPGDTGGGSETLNWCVTVNPVAVLNNNLGHR